LNFGDEKNLHAPGLTMEASPCTSVRRPPEGLENNWIPTAGKLPVPFVRFYGPTDAFFDKTFKMPDVELVK
jgi:hypothetical protein